MLHEDPHLAVASPPPEEQIRAALLGLLDLLAERVAQKIRRELDAEDRQTDAAAPRSADPLLRRPARDTEP
jgi:hypothetical protein